MAPSLLGQLIRRGYPVPTNPPWLPFGIPFGRRQAISTRLGARRLGAAPGFSLVSETAITIQTVLSRPPPFLAVE